MSQKRWLCTRSSPTEFSQSTSFTTVHYLSVHEFSSLLLLQQSPSRAFKTCVGITPRQVQYWTVINHQINIGLLLDLHRIYLKPSSSPRSKKQSAFTIRNLGLFIAANFGPSACNKPKTSPRSDCHKPPKKNSGLLLSSPAVTLSTEAASVYGKKFRATSEIHPLKMKAFILYLYSFKPQFL